MICIIAYVCIMQMLLSTVSYSEFRYIHYIKFINHHPLLISNIGHYRFLYNGERKSWTNGANNNFTMIP